MKTESVSQRRNILLFFTSNTAAVKPSGVEFYP